MPHPFFKDCSRPIRGRCPWAAPPKLGPWMLRGKILFHVVVFRQKTTTYLLQTARFELPALQAHLDKYLIMEEAVLRPLPDLATVTVQGRGAAAVLAGLSCELEGKVAMDRCGLGGFDLLVAESQRLGLLDQLKNLDLAPIDDLALLATRLESFTPSYGAEMVAGENPLTYGKGGTRISYTKGCFLGQETVARSRDRGHPARLLVLLEATTPAPPEKDLLHEGSPAGTWVTQAYAPSRQAFLAFALVKYAHARVDLQLMDASNQAWRVVACSNYSSD